MAEASVLALSFDLKDLFVAYRKAKKEAFNDSNCAHGLKFLNYEKKLTENLDRLRQRLNQPNPDRMSDVDFLGRIACIPKSINPPKNSSQDKSSDPMAHCRSTDPWEYWENCCQQKKAIADFRPVIDATVDFMIISALWILHVGHLYDEKLDPRYVRGNRLRRWRPNKEDYNHRLGELNHRSPNLFRQYFTDYGKWRTDGLAAMRQELMAGHRIVAITMDLKSFYHQVDASFLLEESYLEVMNVLLKPEQRKFTEQIIAAFKRWNAESSIQFGCKAVGLPVGLTASGVIANILLHEFDQEVVAELASIENRCKFQGRVDSIFVPEWNQDIDSFSSLVESAALDVHAYIVQVNNRMYGDSRLRAPMKASYLRDMVRVKGGMSDYYVIGEIDYQSLRGFQSHAAPPTDNSAQYKPFSVGFGRYLSKIRRTTPS